MKIFIPGAGGKVLHIKCLQELPSVQSVVISDIHPWAYGHFVADASYLLPPFEDPQFLSQFVRVYERERFDVCLPLHDASLKLFSDQRDTLAKYPFLLAINSPDTIDLAADKLSLHRFFVRHSIPTPPMHTVADFQKLTNPKFPYYLKPRYIHLRGTERQMFMKLQDQYDVEHTLRRIGSRGDDFVIQEFVSGTEINIDFFCDAEGQVRSIVPLTRLAMGKSRAITRGEILVSNHRFDAAVEQIAAAVKFWGANQLQAFVDETGTTYFTEINARLSGSSVLVKAAGVNFFDYLVRMINGERIEIRQTPKPLTMTCWEQPHFYDRSPACRLS